MTTSIIVRTTYEALHQWKDAPDDVSFLKNLHRHEFHVSLQLEVKHDDRELEFILVKRWIEKLVREYCFMEQHMSCEHAAKKIYDAAMKKYGLRSCSIEVSEDGENGAIIEERV